MELSIIWDIYKTGLYDNAPPRLHHNHRRSSALLNIHLAEVSGHAETGILGIVAMRWLLVSIVLIAGCCSPHVLYTYKDGTTKYE
jgi:hypothetical protein